MFPLIEYDSLLATLMGMFSGELRRKLGALKYDLGWMVSRIEAMSADNEKYHADKVALADYCTELGFENPLTLDNLIASHRLRGEMLKICREQVAELQIIVSEKIAANQDLSQQNSILRTVNEFGTREIANLKERNDRLVTDNLGWKESFYDLNKEYSKLYSIVKKVKEAVE